MAFKVASCIVCFLYRSGSSFGPLCFGGLIILESFLLAFILNMLKSLRI